MKIITLNSLNTILNKIKDFIEKKYTKPDWNATKEEGGYIENKPFFSILSVDGTISNLNYCFDDDTENGLFYPKHDIYVKYENNITLFVKQGTEIVYNDGISIDTGSISLTLDGDLDRGEIFCISDGEDFELIFAINSKFLGFDLYENYKECGGQIPQNLYYKYKSLSKDIKYSIPVFDDDASFTEKETVLILYDVFENNIDQITLSYEDTVMTCKIESRYINGNRLIINTETQSDNYKYVIELSLVEYVVYIRYEEDV